MPQHEYHLSPSSLRFQFLLTCKAEYEDNNEFKERRSVVNKIIEDTEISLHKCCVNVTRIEKEGAIDKLQRNLLMVYLSCLNT